MDGGAWYAVVHGVAKSRTRLSDFTFTFYFHMHWRRKWQPTPVSCLENPRDRGAWWAAIYGVTESDTTEVHGQHRKLCSVLAKILFAFPNMLTINMLSD